MKFMDKQNEPEYLLMNSKLKADKQINKQKKKTEKNKESGKKTEKVGKSKFASKYQDRIQSIKDTEKNIEKKKKLIESTTKRRTTTKKSVVAENTNKDLEINNDVKSEVIKIKNYEEIRKEMLKKFNSGKVK